MEKKYYYSTKETAEILGMCKESVLRGIRNGEIPCKKIGKVFRIPAAYILAEQIKWTRKRRKESSGSTGNEDI